MIDGTRSCQVVCLKPIVHTKFLMYALGRVRLVETRRDTLRSVQGGGGGCALLGYTRLTTTYGGPPATAPGPLPPPRVTCLRTDPAQPNPAQHHERWTRLGACPVRVPQKKCIRATGDRTALETARYLIDRLRRESGVAEGRSQESRMYSGLGFKCSCGGV